MPDPRLDVLCIGNAIVDVIANADDDFLAARGPGQGLDAADRRRGGRAALCAHGPGAPGQRRIGGEHGGGRRGARRPRRLHRPGRGRPARRILSPRPHRRRGRVHHPGRRRRRADRALPDPRHARRPADDEHLPRRGAAPARRARSTRSRSASRAILYLEGYLWDPETPRDAMVRAIEVAREAGRKVAFTLSDMFCVERHRDGFSQLLDERPDRHPVRQRGRDRGACRSRRTSRARSPRSRPRSRRWSSPAARMARSRPAAASAPTCPPSRSTSWSTRPAPATCSPPASCSATARGKSLEQSLRLGAIGAAEVIQHYGARPEADLKALAGELAA